MADIAEESSVSQANWICKRKELSDFTYLNNACRKWESLETEDWISTCGFTVEMLVAYEFVGAGLVQNSNVGAGFVQNSNVEAGSKIQT